jgi:hypothetical protein
VKLLIIILVEMLKIFTLFNKICGYREPAGTGMGMGTISYPWVGMRLSMGTDLSCWVWV